MSETEPPVSTEEELDPRLCPVSLGPDCLGFICMGCGRRVGSYVER